MITNEQKDMIYNGLVVGMSLEDAYVLAGLTPAQVAEVSDDNELQADWARNRKQHEYMLLSQLNTVIDKQTRAGKDSGVTWALEHIYPNRYANKNVGDGRTVNIVIDGKKDPAADTEVVEIHN